MTRKRVWMTYLHRVCDRWNDLKQSREVVLVTRMDDGRLLHTNLTPKQAHELAHALDRMAVCCEVEDWSVRETGKYMV